MAITVADEGLGRGFTSSSSNQGFTLQGVSDYTEIIEWIGDNAPDTFMGFAFSDFDAKESDEIPGQYALQLKYGILEPTKRFQTGSVEKRFNFQATFGKFYQSLQTISTTYNTTDFPGDIAEVPTDGAINVTGELHEAQGIDVPTPAEVFTVCAYPTLAEVTPAYRQTLYNLCGCVNSVSYEGLPAGSLMLVRAQGQSRNDQDMQLELGFGYIPNRTNIPVGPHITVANKDGMDLLWPFYGLFADSGAHGVSIKAKAALVERIFYRGDLNALGTF